MPARLDPPVSPPRPSPRRRVAAAEVATGVWFFPDTPSGVIVEAAHRAEDLGLDELWLGDEGPARDPFALLAAAATVTHRLRLGVAVTNPYLRHPAGTATAAMTVHELSEGRFRLGIGPGGSIALDPVGVRRIAPLARTREAVRLIRAVADGRATDGYLPSADPFRVPGLPVWVGARGEGFNRFASEAADGVFIGGVPLTALDLVLGWARSVRDIPVALHVNAVFDPVRVEEVRPRMIFALLDAPEAFRRLLDVEREPLVRAALALAAGDPGPASAIVDDDRLDQLILRGTPELVGERLAALVTRHAPSSIGVALLDPDPVGALEPVARAFRAMKAVRT